jgi:hypothetical protein
MHDQLIPGFVFGFNMSCVFVGASQSVSQASLLVYGVHSSRLVWPSPIFILCCTEVFSKAFEFEY